MILQSLVRSALGQGKRVDPHEKASKLSVSSDARHSQDTSRLLRSLAIDKDTVETCASLKKISVNSCRDQERWNDSQQAVKTSVACENRKVRRS